MNTLKKAFGTKSFVSPNLKSKQVWSLWPTQYIKIPWTELAGGVRVGQKTRTKPPSSTTTTLKFWYPVFMILVDWMSFPNAYMCTWIFKMLNSHCPLLWPLSCGYVSVMVMKRRSWERSAVWLNLSLKAVLDCEILYKPPSSSHGKTAITWGHFLSSFPMPATAGNILKLQFCCLSHE